ncbi:MAG: hypothetical protein EHM46_05585 [Bacteroidetes bacterium]|nr:MAG: hypothetical protein EHM46_05585 [Bacteroidota bacterium]
MRSCADCHDNGYLGAPVAKHRWLPPVHLDKMACQACHIPGRTVKSAHFVASDVFNPGTKIPTRGKYLWTFYGPDMNYWNHYGDLEMMGYDDKPTYAFRPELVRYKGMIYPVNRVHTAWPAIQTEGIPGLMQPKMGDIYKMWADHFQDPGKYAELASIRDDNNDNVIEVNSAGEIDALIAAITRKLAETSYPMENSQVVWVMNDRVYASGDTYTEIPMEPWEASPYGNVHTYNHDIFPANSALGVNGCTDCHSYGSDFFTARVVQYPFDSDGHTVTVPQFTSLGISGLQAHSGMIRESFLKPVLYLLIAIFIILAVILGFRRLLEPLLPALWLNASSILIFIGFLFILIRAIPDEQLSLYMLPSRFWLDSNHFFIGILVLLTSAALLAYSMNLQGAGSITRSKLRTPGVHLLVTASMIVAVISGSLMMLLNHWAIYILFDMGLILSLTGSILVLYAAGVQKQKEIITSTDQLK